LPLRSSIAAFRIVFTICVAAAVAPCDANAQQLNKPVSLNLRNMSLAQVLDSIASQGHFQFSYNSSILSEDSLVTILVGSVPVRGVLDILLGTGYIYIEQGNHLIILRPSTGQPPIEHIYQISGYIFDAQTGEGLEDASVFVKTQLQATLTDKQGFFKLRLASKDPYPLITVSKAWYRDTTVFIYPGYDQQLRLNLTPVKPDELPPAYLSYSSLEHTRWARILLSSKQRLQSLNLAHFFTHGNAQLSLFPFLGTNGRMTGQVVNKFSLNLIGGYTAGLNGFELATVFNLDKRDVRSVQVAGLLNVVGGKMSGVQIAGYQNICKDTVRGLQISGVFNNARFLKGVQIGLFNVADSSVGYSIGLVSIVRHGGINRLAVEMREVTGISLKYIQGNKNLNSLLLVGYNPWSIQKPISFGYGIGKSFRWRAPWGLYTQVTGEALYNSHFSKLGALYRFQPDVECSLSRKISFFAGPTFALFAATAHSPSGRIWPPAWAKDPLSGIWDGKKSFWVGFSTGILIL
jgi:hypothetical protein